MREKGKLLTIEDTDKTPFVPAKSFKQTSISFDGCAGFKNSGEKMNKPYLRVNKLFAYRTNTQFQMIFQLFVNRMLLWTISVQFYEMHSYLILHFLPVFLLASWWLKVLWVIGNNKDPLLSPSALKRTVHFVVVDSLLELAQHKHHDTTNKHFEDVTHKNC